MSIKQTPERNNSAYKTSCIWHWASNNNGCWSGYRNFRPFAHGTSPCSSNLPVLWLQSLICLLLTWTIKIIRVDRRNIVHFFILTNTCRSWIKDTYATWAFLACVILRLSIIMTESLPALSDSIIEVLCCITQSI